MSEVKFISVHHDANGARVLIDMKSYDREEKTYNAYIGTEWVRVTRKAVLAMTDFLPCPECNAFVEHLVDMGVVFRRWQYQIMV